MILTSKHTTSFSNPRKLENLDSFVSEYRRCLDAYISYIWENGYSWSSDKGDFRFSPKDGQLDIPMFFETELFKKAVPNTFLSGRAAKCLTTQARAMISAECEKQRKRLYILKERKKEKGNAKHLIKKIKQNNPVKPYCGNVRPELNSICVDFQYSKGEFDGFLMLKSICKDGRKIKIPIKFHKHSNYLKGELMTSFLIGSKNVDLRLRVKAKDGNENGVILGADQGLKKVLTFSDGTHSGLVDNHNHTLESIVSKVARKRKGSKALQRAKSHQKNFVNWSIKQIDFSKIKEIRLEEVININKGRRTSRKMSHWQNTLIRDKVQLECEKNGVRFTLQSSTYRSQRCFACGNVRKANRKGEEYLCKNCGYACDADVNAAKNLELELPDIPHGFRQLKKNRGDGFIWSHLGLFDLSGGSLQSPS